MLVQYELWRIIKPEIRDAERKAIAEVRRWRREASKERKSLSPAELEAYWEKIYEELNAQGIPVVSSLK